MDKKKILVIATGGTIESFYGVEGDGGKNAPYNVPQDEKSIIPEALKDLGLSDKCTFYEACQRDSKGVNSDILHHIALYLSEHIAEYDGIVVVHGTDTMPRNARALEDILESAGIPSIPIVFTGSMTPLRDENKKWRKDSDGWANLQKSIRDAERQSPGIYIRMDGFLVDAHTVDKNVTVTPDNIVKEARFVDYDRDRWEPIR